MALPRYLHLPPHSLRVVLSCGAGPPCSRRQLPGLRGLDEARHRVGAMCPSPFPEEAGQPPSLLSSGTREPTPAQLSLRRLSCTVRVHQWRT